jgi:hypothetical protein
MGMRRLGRRGLAVGLAAALTIVLAGSATVAQAAGTTTNTTLATESQQISGRAVTTYSATVLGEDGSPASGIVTLIEGQRTLASAALDAQGKAEIRYDSLPGGDHLLSAVYSGDSAHGISKSNGVKVHADATTGAPDFTIAISPTSLPSVTAGQSGNVTATITSVNQFTGFLSLSCAGAPVSAGSATDNAMPVGVTCTFTPANLQVTTATATSSNPTITSSLVVQTTAPAGKNAQNHSHLGLRDAGSPRMLAILLPGVAGLGFLARKRKLFGNVALLLLVGGVALLGTTSCSARYSYLHHPPTYNGGTPVGSYTLTVWAQTSDGVTASEHFTTLGLTVK